MKFINLHGYEDKVTCLHKYCIDWSAESRSNFQKEVKLILKEYWGFEEVYEEFPLVGTALKFDFYNKTRELVIEADGDQHYKYNKHFHNKSRGNFINSLKRDDKKEIFCERNLITLYRVRQRKGWQNKLRKFLDE